MTTVHNPTVFLSSITSDIGIELATRYSRDGYTVTGTYRSTALLDRLRHLPGCHLFYCDLADPSTIERSNADFRVSGLRWDTFISCASWPPPLTSFFASDFDQWSLSVHVNAIEQLRVLHGLFPLRRSTQVADVVYFAGPATNNAVRNFSALALSKIMLIKMCELLDAENEDLNVFIVGPGWTRTKTHDLILADPYVSAEKRADTLKFLETQEGTSMDDIYESIRWLCRQGRAVAGGRNFSVVHDLWGSEALASALAADRDMYKLRRYGNNWKDRADV